jgi:predicted nucleic acid-binding Zn finger protein
MPASGAHIAGIGISSATSRSEVDKIAVSAITKALLDAGITFAKVEQCVASSLEESQLRIKRSVFQAFGRPKAPICDADNHSALFTTVGCVKSGQTDCALVVAFDTDGKNGQIAVVAVVLVSDRMLTSHSYLKDSAVQVRSCVLATPQNAARKTEGAAQAALRQAGLGAWEMQILDIREQGHIDTSSMGRQIQDLSSALAPLQGFGTTGLASLCGLGKNRKRLPRQFLGHRLTHSFPVWRFRGWTEDQTTRLENCLQLSSKPDGSAASVMVLGRSDGQAAPAYQTVLHLRDGRERLRYNPAKEMRGIDGEDVEVVRIREGDRLLEENAVAVKQLQLSVKGGDRATLARL